MKKILKLLIAILFSAQLFAQAPNKMSYQAVIRNSSNNLVTTKSIGMQISILQGSVTGTAVYVERQFPTTNANGLATIEIGTGTIVSGSFSTINWASGPYFIKTETDINGGSTYTITGTSELMSVPYALFAANSAPGPQGITGIQGIKGDSGARGLTGPQGLQGIQGAQGIQGIKGDSGARGLIGPQGVQGVQGIQGIKGDSGARGLAGPQGIQGIQGIKGDSGARGLTGPQGIQGVQGVQGVSGASSSWGLLGNVVGSGNFIGTTNGVPLKFKVNNQPAGSIGSGVNTSFGYLSSANEFLTYYDGINNTATGYKAFNLNWTGDDNTSNGYMALSLNDSGSYNTAIGSQALYLNTKGENNTGIGYRALYSNTTGVNNTANGVIALQSNTTGSRNIAIGYYALGTNSSGINNTAIGYGALASNTIGINNIAIGYDAQTPSFTASNQVRIGNGSITYAGIQVAWTVTSDKRWKSNIQNSNLGLDFITKLRPVSYFRNNDESKKLEYGFIAQELEEVLNNAGVTNNGIISKDDAGMYGVRYNDLMAPMVKAIQEQQLMIETLKKQIEILKNK